MNISIREIGENIKNSKNFTGEVLYDISLKDYTTIKTGGNASLFIRPQSELALKDAVLQCKKASLPVFVLGGGSNLVINDEGLNQAVVYTAGLNIFSIKSNHAYPYEMEDLPFVKEACPVQISCGAGMTVNSLCDFCAKYGIIGLESFAGLPGTLGGAAFMNARCYEKNIGDFIAYVRYLDLDAIDSDEGNANIIKEYASAGDEKSWGYKKSPFQDMNVVILSVTLRATCIDVNISGGMTSQPAIYDYIRKKNDYYINDRIQKGHFKSPSAGSVFKNNHDFGKPSGRIIDELGLKGLTKGGAKVADWHGNFIINTGNATSSDIKALVQEIQSTVKEKTGFTLEPEIIFV